jgi:hypothetical protein
VKPLLYGLRSWAGAPGEKRLIGPQRGARWPPGGALLEAECSATPSHAPPGAACSCGLHAWHPSRAAARRVCGVRRDVAGILEAWGAVEVHADGFRAERGRPHASVLLPSGNARRLERLAATYDAELLCVDGPDALLACCRDRDLGLVEGVVAELVGSERLAAARRQRRPRWALRAIAVAGALALAGGVVAVDPGTEHGEVLHGRSGEIRVPSRGLPL